jgi:hypothetical protein
MAYKLSILKRMRGDQVGRVEAEGAESEGENERGPSQRGRISGGRVGVVDAEGPWNSRVFGPQMELAYRLFTISQGPKNSRIPGQNPLPLPLVMDMKASLNIMSGTVLHVTGNDQDYLRKIPRACSDICASLKGPL